MILFLLACNLQGATDPCATEPVYPPDAKLQEEIQEGETPAQTAELAPDRPLPFVWVLDHSGSMYPGYHPGAGKGTTPWYVELPEFRDLVVNTLGKGFRDGKDSAWLYVFNEEAWSWDGTQASHDARAPVHTLAELGTRLGALPGPPYGAAVAGLPAPRRGANDCGTPGAAANCSRMAVGLDAALKVLDANGGEGIVWLVTDNIYEGRPAAAPGLAQAEIESNATFYRALRDDPRVDVIQAWPVRMPAGGWLKDSSLFVYGIHYSSHGKPTLPELRRLIGEDGVGPIGSPDLAKAMAAYASPESPSPGEPFRLKPLDADVVRVRLAAEVEAASHVEFGQPVPMKASLVVENLLPHRRLDAVTFKVRGGKWVGYDLADGKKLETVEPVCPGFESAAVTAGPIAPGGSQTIEVTWALPGVRTEWHTLGDLLQIAGNEHVVMGGALYAELTELRSSLAIEAGDLQGVYGVEALPDIFANPRNTPYTTRFAGHSRAIENPGMEAAMLALAGMVGVGSLGLLGLWMSRSVGREVFVDGQSVGVLSIGRLFPRPIQVNGRTIATARLSMAGAVRVSAPAGAKARPEGRTTQVTTADGRVWRVEVKGLGAGRKAGGGPAKPY